MPTSTRAARSTNYGTNILLRLDGGTDPDREGYLRFDVSGITGTVQSAKLRLYSPNGTDNGPEVYPVSDTTWAETGIKWSNKPARGATALADVAKVTTNTWVEYSLSPVTVTANGPYSFVLVAQSTDGVDFNSRENTTNPPQLVLTIGTAPPPPDTTPPSTPVLTLTETAPEAHVAGSTLFYNPAVGSTSNVTVAASTTDAESGITQVAFPAVFGSDGVNDPTAPYSTSYSWSAGASASGAQTVTATNGAGLTATSSFTVTPDSTGPAAFALSAPADGATIQNGQAVSAAPSDADSGVAQVEFRYCAGSELRLEYRDGHRHR